MSTVKIGVMPGRVQEFVVEESTTFAELFTLADVNPQGYEVKADGVKVTDYSQSVGTTQLVLLAKQVKGNADVVVKIGVMPGRVQEFAVSTETTYNELFTLADVNPDGYEVKADGSKVTDFNSAIGSTSLVLLAKQVKGNGLVKVGVMPGRVNEFSVEESTTYNELFTLADVNPEGYEVKADGVKVTDFNTQVGSVQLVLLAKQVKGNILGGLGGGLLGGMKSARVGDQIDAEAKSGKMILSNALLVAQQFDFVESQLAQFAQILSQQDPSSAMQFQNMQQQINNIQSQMVNAINQGVQTFTNIDTLTNSIQN
jgi:hypothetical protein